MPEIIVCQGLQASGKSTWARTQAELPGWWRINKDDLRAMCKGPFRSSNEKSIVAARDALINLFMESGFNIIVDDTNFHPSHLARIQDLARAFSHKTGGKVKYTVELKFFEVTLEDAIKRDLKRPNPVGEAVIRRTYNQWLAPKPEIIEHDSTLPSAIIVDMDGTLAHFNGRGPYDFDKCNTDTLDEVVAGIVRDLNYVGEEIIVVSGRDDSCMEMTVEWLNDNGIPFNRIFMRETGNKEKDSIVKRKIFDQHIRGKYNIKLVLDDRNQVVDMWRQLGLKCLQVAPGDF